MLLVIERAAFNAFQKPSVCSETSNIKFPNIKCTGRTAEVFIAGQLLHFRTNICKLIRATCYLASVILGT